MSYEDYLQHHGIMGMRWGKRNGPPYPLSFKKLSSSEKKARAVTVDTSNGEKTVSNRKPVKDMSDRELDDALKRLRKEKEYRELTENDITKGAAWLKAILLATGGVAITGMVTGTGKKLASVGNKYIGKGIDKGEDWIKDQISLFKIFSNLR